MYFANTNESRNYVWRSDLPPWEQWKDQTQLLWCAVSYPTAQTFASERGRCHAREPSTASDISSKSFPVHDTVPTAAIPHYWKLIQQSFIRNASNKQSIMILLNSNIVSILVLDRLNTHFSGLDTIYAAYSLQLLICISRLGFNLVLQVSSSWLAPISRKHWTQRGYNQKRV